MLQVRNGLCTGCGLCAQSCPAEAITLCYQRGSSHAKAVIDLARCINCQACAQVCPQGAIQPVFAGELEELKLRIQEVRRRKDWILKRLERMTPTLRK